MDFCIAIIYPAILLNNFLVQVGPLWIPHHFFHGRLDTAEYSSCCLLALLHTLARMPRTTFYRVDVSFVPDNSVSPEFSDASAVFVKVVLG